MPARAALVGALRRAVPERLKELRATRWLRLWLAFNLRLKRRLKRQLTGRGAHGSRADGPRVLVPLIETSHYQYLQVLILAKALQMRGAHVRVLICGQSLEGCEIK